MKQGIVLTDLVIEAIRWIRGQKVLLDADLGNLYGVTTGNLNKAVSRNRDRFPDDFMFRLTTKEARNLRFQFGIASWGGRRARPYAFTEQRVAVLSGVLNSSRAVKVNIAIIEAIRQLMSPSGKPRREIGFHLREKTARYRTRNGR